MKSIKLTIPTPCHENWEEMLPEEKGKFCLSCQKTVVDFSRMSDQEVFNYFKNNSNGRTCGRFVEGQLNKKISINRPNIFGRWKYFWQILLPAVFTVYKSNAQTTAGEIKITTCQKDTSSKPDLKLVGKIAISHQKQTFVKVFSIKGKVVDNQGKGIKHATVKINGAASKAEVTTDSHGNFKLLASNVYLPLTLNVLCAGFYSKEIEITTNHTSQRVILQNAERMLQGDVSIEQ